ncbi:MAG: PTS transporter subunit EIIC [Metamycoplasmataceae bacterium]
MVSTKKVSKNYEFTNKAKYFLNKIKPKNSQEFLSKLSKSLMIPIAILPIAGLFLAIGATISSQVSVLENAPLYFFAKFLSDTGDIVFGNLQTLFCVSIAITFAKNEPFAGLVAFLMILVFNVTQRVFIFSNNDSFSIFWYQDVQSSQLTSNLGIFSLQTSVFGGIVIGFITAWVYNKFKNIQMPSFLGFFSGIRFVLILGFLMGIPIAIIFLMVWPLIGEWIAMMGQGLSSAPAGLNSLAFGTLNRMLIPFGLHHILNTTFWFTNVGGSITETMINAQAIVGGVDLGKTWGELGLTLSDGNINTFVNGLLPVVGQKINGITLTFENVSQALNAINPSNSLGVVGAYTSGAYIYTMFGLPAAAAAMVMAAPKENRKMSLSIVGSAAVTAFVTGITEPIEFTFLFLVPWLYYGFHAIIGGICYWVANLLGAHVAFGFSSGLIDLTIYGFITDAIGAQSNSWILILSGLVIAPLYYFVFYFAIKKFDLKTPGRGGNDKLFSKEDYKKQKSQDPNSKEAIKEAFEIINAYGGLSNMKEIDACITRLRIVTNDASKVDKDKLLSLGAIGFGNSSPNSVHAIFGTKADGIKNNILNIKNNNLKYEDYQDVQINSHEEHANKVSIENNELNQEIKVLAPFSGKIIPLNEVPDETFANGIVGQGIALKPSTKILYSPLKRAKLNFVFPGGHAYNFETKDKTNFLVHIGIDSVNAKEHNIFDNKFQDSSQFIDNELKITNIDLEKLNQYAKSSITPILVLNESLNGREIIFNKTSGDIKKGELLFTIKGK